MIADDHPLIRKGFREALMNEPEFNVVAEASDGREVLDLIDKTKVDIIVMDISMPGMTGLEVLEHLKKEHKKIPILILSVHPEDGYAIRSLKSGASGYLTKESTPEELIYAIRKVARGGKYITPSLADKIIEELERVKGPNLHDSLSNREFEILCMIARGKSVRQISEALYISIQTVHTYRNRILEKMKMKSNIELTHYAIQHSLIECIKIPGSKKRSKL